MKHRFIKWFDWLKNVEVDTICGIAPENCKAGDTTKMWINTGQLGGSESGPVRALVDLRPGMVLTAELINGQPCVRPASTRLVWMWKRPKGATS